MEKKITWKVTENNGGGLTLYVYDNDELVYAHAGYEFAPGNLKDDIQALNDGQDPVSDSWDGNDLYDTEIIKAVRTIYDYAGEHTGDIYDENGNIIPLDNDEYYDNHESTRVIADQDGPIDSDNMGAAGNSVFYA